MVRSNHLLAGAILAESIILFADSGLPRETFATNLLELLSGEMPVDRSLVGFCATIIFASLMGSILPDADVYWARSGRFHRTVLHWPPLYLAGAMAAWFYHSNFFFVLCLAALLHIFMDSFSKAGVPVLHPFRDRHGFRVFYVGTVAEIIVAMILGCVGILVWKLATYPI